MYFFQQMQSPPPQVENNNLILAHNRKLPYQIYLYDTNIESFQLHILLTTSNIFENVMVYGNIFE